MLLAYAAGSKKVQARHAAAATREYDQSRVPRAALVTDAPASVWRRSLTPALLLAGLVLFNIARHGWFHHAPPPLRDTLSAGRSPKAPLNPKQPATAQATSGHPSHDEVRAALSHSSEPAEPHAIVKASTNIDSGANAGPAAQDFRRLPELNPSHSETRW